MKKYNFIYLIVIILLLFLVNVTIIASELINVKDYIKGRFPVIFNIYLASFDDLDEDEKEFIDLLEKLPEERQIEFAKDIYDNGFSEDIVEIVRETIIIIENGPEEPTEEPVLINTGKWIYGKKLDPIKDKPIITFTLENENVKETENPVYLSLRHENGKTYVEIDWNYDMYSVYRGMINVATRFGDNKASRLSWELYSGTKEIILETIFGVQPKVPHQITSLTRNKSRFISNLLEVDRFAAQVKLSNKPDITAVFDVRGLKDAISQYNDILEWIE
ncbi:MAG: hypothetical protein PHX56_08495 [Atribacterota bacterium]|nr:hypothetical protein [Atribacterota bacterium]